MLNIGSKIVELRKAKNWSQEDLAKQIQSSRVMVGNYERNTNTPSVDILLKIAKAFDVSLDYLVGEGQLSVYDKDVLKRIEDIEQLDEDSKSKLFFVIDNVIQNFKAKKAFL
jgi:transcriptional regulator with XRE-family HTH domain